MRHYNLILSKDEETVIYATYNNVACVSSDGSFYIKNIENEIFFSKGYSHKFAVEYTRLVVTSKVNNNKINLLIGSGEYLQPLNFGNSVVKNEPEISSTINNIADIDLVQNTVKKIADLDNNKKEVIINNLSDKLVRIGDANITATKGIVLIPDGSLVLSYKGELHALTAYTGVKLAVTEVLK